MQNAEILAQTQRAFISDFISQNTALQKLTNDRKQLISDLYERFKRDEAEAEARGEILYLDFYLQSIARATSTIWRS